MSEHIEFKLRSSKEWIEVFPYGVALISENSRPVMIFKDEKEKYNLPVWLSPLDAGIAVSQRGYLSSASPHNLTWKILEPFQLELKKCFFTEVRGYHQFVDLHFAGNNKMKKLESRADEAISFCLSAETQFFCQLSFIQQCRDIEIEMVDASQGQHPEHSRNDHPYLN